LIEIQKVRDAGETKAVVVSATGTGKTILSALDVRAARPQRLLFVVHREQILDRAIEEFRKVLNAPASDFGKFVGARREIDRKYVFATVQSLTRSENLNLFARDGFDYVIIDEVHRAGAESYRRLINHIRPAFLLGITATPERTDDFNVFELFDYNVPYEIRLQQALEEDMLAPFHYYGVTDFERDGEAIDETSQLRQLVAPERADHLVRAIELYGHAGVPVRGLMFCSRRQEAVELSRLLNERTVHRRRLRTRALTGEDSIDERERVVEELESGKLDYIVTVDVFNEGIDIPTVNQVVMLRQTQSSIIFTQQLGRGLRKAAGKDHLIVIDFIGNYTNNYLIPIALFGNSSLNKDSVRRDIIDSQEAGAISGLSSVNFDKIASERIFASLAATRLDSMKNLKQTFNELRNRLGRAPRLIDFARFDVADPVVVACKKDNYWNLLITFKSAERCPNPDESQVLSFLSNEILNGKRPHELLLIEALLTHGNGLSQSEYIALLHRNDCASDDKTIRSVARILSLEFFTEPERKKYGHPVVVTNNGRFQFSATMQELLQDADFAAHVHDIVETGLYLARHRYSWTARLEIGHRYSRKDVCRLLNWEKNEQGTIFGYKVDYHSNSCPIFITYHKHEDVTASTAYGDEFMNESALHWFTRSKRTLQSSEVRAIVENRVPLHLFAKKDDAEGTDFYYLGRARSSNAEQKQMPGNSGQPLDVVTMTLGMESPIEASLYEYLTAR
jgi:superfamily II DNA or RNA helicase